MHERTGPSAWPQAPLPFVTGARFHWAESILGIYGRPLFWHHLHATLSSLHCRQMIDVEVAGHRQQELWGSNMIKRENKWRDKIERPAMISWLDSCCVLSKLQAHCSHLNPYWHPIPSKGAIKTLSWCYFMLWWCGTWRKASGLNPCIAQRLVFPPCRGSGLLSSCWRRFCASCCRIAI